MQSVSLGEVIIPDHAIPTSPYIQEQRHRKTLPPQKENLAISYYLPGGDVSVYIINTLKTGRDTSRVWITKKGIHKSEYDTIRYHICCGHFTFLTKFLSRLIFRTANRLSTGVLIQFSEAYISSRQVLCSPKCIAPLRNSPDSSIPYPN